MKVEEKHYTHINRIFTNTIINCFICFSYAKLKSSLNEFY